MKRKASLLIPDFLPLAGAEKILLDLAHDQLLRGFDVDVITCYETQNISNFFSKEIRLINFNSHSLSQSFIPLVKYLKQEKPDVLVVFMWPLTVVAILAKIVALSSVRLITTDHNTLSMQYASKSFLMKMGLRFSIMLTYPFAKYRVAVSRGVAKDLMQLSKLKQNSFKVIYNPIKVMPSTPLGRDFANEIWDVLGTGTRILNVGRLKRQKNQKLLLEAFAQVLEVFDASLVILSDGEDAIKKELQLYIAEHDLKNRVRLVPHVDDLTAWYESADMFVLSSDYEGFGNVLVEALNAGLPIVSTDCPSGPSEILSGGEFGRLVPVGRSDLLAHAIIETKYDHPSSCILKNRAKVFMGDSAFLEYSSLMHD